MHPNPVTNGSTGCTDIALVMAVGFDSCKDAGTLGALLRTQSGLWCVLKPISAATRATGGSANTLGMQQLGQASLLQLLDAKH